MIDKYRYERGNESHSPPNDQKNERNYLYTATIGKKMKLKEQHLHLTQ